LKAGLLHARRWPPVVGAFDLDEVARFVRTHFIRSHVADASARRLSIGLRPFDGRN
jgi:hypothetical protein